MNIRLGGEETGDCVSTAICNMTAYKHDRNQNEKEKDGEREEKMKIV